MCQINLVILVESDGNTISLWQKKIIQNFQNHGFKNLTVVPTETKEIKKSPFIISFYERLDYLIFSNISNLCNPLSQIKIPENTTMVPLNKFHEIEPNIDCLIDLTEIKGNFSNSDFIACSLNIANKTNVFFKMIKGINLVKSVFEITLHNNVLNFQAWNGVNIYSLYLCRARIYWGWVHRLNLIFTNEHFIHNLYYEIERRKNKQSTNI